jgi:hypothetical protein
MTGRPETSSTTKINKTKQQIEEKQYDNALAEYVLSL